MSESALRAKLNHLLKKNAFVSFFSKNGTGNSESGTWNPEYFCRKSFFLLFNMHSEFSVVLGRFDQRVTVADVGLLHAVEQHVHAADTQHGAIEVVAVEGPLVGTVAGGLVAVDGIAVMADQICRGGDQKPSCTAGRVADRILGCRRGHLHHQLDDVARGSKLAVLPGSVDISEHVFVEVALGVRRAPWRKSARTPSI